MNFTGARVLVNYERTRESEGRGAALGFPLAAVHILKTTEGGGDHLGCRRRAVDPVASSSPRSCFRCEVDDNEEVSWVGPWWLACWASADGPWPGKFFFSILFFFSIFCVMFLIWISILSLQILNLGVF
jgi:hypothetical protein